MGYKLHGKLRARACIGGPGALLLIHGNMHGYTPEWSGGDTSSDVRWYRPWGIDHQHFGLPVKFWTIKA